MKTLSSTITESLNESFYRLPKDVIKNDVHQVKGMFASFVSKVETGEDVNMTQLVEIIKALTKIADSTKEFKKKEDVDGTVYESIQVIDCSTAKSGDMITYSDDGGHLHTGVVIGFDKDRRKVYFKEPGMGADADNYSAGWNTPNRSTYAEPKGKRILYDKRTFMHD